jgi:hypothetical protein
MGKKKQTTDISFEQFQKRYKKYTSEPLWYASCQTKWKQLKQKSNYNEAITIFYEQMNFKIKKRKQSTPFTMASQAKRRKINTEKSQISQVIHQSIPPKKKIPIKKDPKPKKPLKNLNIKLPKPISKEPQATPKQTEIMD